MAFKQFVLADHKTTVTIYKRKANRSLRLSIAPNGEVRVSIPNWAPYASGVNFASSRLQWIKSQRRQAPLLVPNQAIGKAHHLRFVASSSLTRPTSRVLSNDIKINYPIDDVTASPSVQKIATAASIRALRAQAEKLLPQRLAKLAQSRGYDYRKVTVKQLKSRWGSCDQHGNIVLNLFLMQLPWECIDYVLIHELVHTKVLRHGPDFWQAMEHELPRVNQLRQLIRSYQPILHGSLEPAVA